VVSAEVRIGTQGRLVLARAIREELGAAEGATYVARVEDGRLILETRDAILARLRAHAAAADGGDGSWVDQLIAERRAEARREAAEG
jgi:bifunctional DNA-binding transcriptional regulator/antitoxin component of YhaV-PrlF toxin-antitoxin module